MVVYPRDTTRIWYLKGPLPNRQSCLAVVVCLGNLDLFGTTF